MNSATIGSALTEKRTALGLEKGQAADRIGMSRTTYSSYEQDAQRPSVDVFPALANFLGVTIEEFLLLYGATSIAAVRPALDRLLSSSAQVGSEDSNQPDISIANVSFREAAAGPADVTKEETILETDSAALLAASKAIDEVEESGESPVAPALSTATAPPGGSDVFDIGFGDVVAIMRANPDSPSRGMQESRDKETKSKKKKKKKKK